MSPTQRTRAYLKSKGFISHITEKWNPHARKRQDMFGFIDLVYMNQFTKKIVGVQMTSGAHHADHKAKILGECRALAGMWLLCGGEIEIWSWSKKRSEKVTKTGRRSKVKVWAKRVEVIGLLDVPQLQPASLHP